MQDTTRGNKSIRVLHINCNYLGTPLHQLMVDSLQTLNVDSRVFVPISPKYEIRVKANDNVVSTTCFTEIDRFFFFIKQNKIIRALESEIHVQDFDCLHAYTLFTDGYCALRLYKKYQIPYIVAIRDTDINLYYRKRKYLAGVGTQILLNASKVLFLSEQYKKTLINNYVPKKYREEISRKTEVIPNGIDDFWHINENTERERMVGCPLRIIYAGRIMKRKNVGTTVKACKELQRRGIEITFTIVGKITDKDEYESIKNEKFIRFVDPQPKEKLIDYYRESDVFVMPSFTETFGLVYPEAMSQGLPVIYTKGQGFDGQFPDREVGIAVDPLDPNNISDAIEEIVENYDEYCNRCLVGSRKFDWGKIAERYKELYNCIIV